MSVFGTQSAEFSGDMGGNKLENVGDPTNPSDATTKRYVDNKAPALVSVPDTLNIATGSRWRPGASAKIVFGNELTYIKRNHGSREVAMTGDLHINATGNTVRRDGELVIKQKHQIGVNRAGGLVFENTSTGHAYFCGYAQGGPWGIFYIDAAGEATQILQLNHEQINLLKTTNMNGQTITGLPVTYPPTGNDQATSWSQVARLATDTAITRVDKAGDSMTGNLSMGGNVINGLPTTYPPTGEDEAPSWSQVRQLTSAAAGFKVSITGDTMTGDLNMGGYNKVTGLATPTGATDATNKGYVDSLSIIPAVISAYSSDNIAFAPNAVVRIQLDNANIVKNMYLSDGDLLVANEGTYYFKLELSPAPSRGRFMLWISTSLDGSDSFINERTTFTTPNNRTIGNPVILSSTVSLQRNSKVRFLGRSTQRTVLQHSPISNTRITAKVDGYRVA